MDTMHDVLRHCYDIAMTSPWDNSTGHMRTYQYCNSCRQFVGKTRYTLVIIPHTCSCYMYEACLQYTPPIRLRLNGITVLSKRCCMKIGLNSWIPHTHTHLSSVNGQGWQLDKNSSPGQMRWGWKSIESGLCAACSMKPKVTRGQRMSGMALRIIDKNPTTIKAMNYVRQIHNNTCIERCNILGDVRCEGAPMVD